MYITNNSFLKIFSQCNDILVIFKQSLKFVVKYYKYIIKEYKRICIKESH